jgi:hypothetical protein
VISLRATLAGVALAATVSLVASGCDSSPFAASVNGQVVKQTALDAELAGRSANKAYIASVDATAASQHLDLKVEGPVSGTYSTAWAAQVLGEIVDGVAIHQHLSATHDLPSPAVTTAATAIQAAIYAQNLTWYHFSPAQRAAFADRFADEAVLYPSTGVPASYLKQVFAAYGGSLFTSVCIQTVNVSVSGAGGVLDLAASRSRALAVQRAIDAGTGGSEGSTTCYDQTGFAALPLGLISTVLGLAAHRASVPQKTTYGYQVIGVPTRHLIPTGPALDQVLSAANNVKAGANRTAAVIAAARVQVNPAYGTWARSGGVYRIVPPSTARFTKAS